MTPEEQNREIASRDYDALIVEAGERLKYQTEFAHNTLRGLSIGNGGAILALLTFIGNSSAAERINEDAIRWAFGYFSAGLIATFLASFGAFFSQGYYMETSLKQAWSNQAKTVGSKKRWDWHTPFQRGLIAQCLGIVFAACSLAAFILGASSALAGIL